MRLEQQLALRHEAKDAFVVDRLGAGCMASAVQERRDPPVTVSRAGIGELADGSQKFVIALPLIAAAGFGAARQLLDEMRPGDAKRVGHNLHREASRGGDGNCQTGFFSRAVASGFRACPKFCVRGITNAEEAYYAKQSQEG